MNVLAIILILLAVFCFVFAAKNDLSRCDSEPEQWTLISVNSIGALVQGLFLLVLAYIIKTW